MDFDVVRKSVASVAVHVHGVEADGRTINVTYGFILGGANEPASPTWASEECPDSTGVVTLRFFDRAREIATKYLNDAHIKRVAASAA